jgi:transketolase
MASIKQFVQDNLEVLTDVSNTIRGLGMDAVLGAKSGHVGLPLGGAEMATLLYFGVMKFNSKDPNWPDRDRFVLSAGHGSMLQYAALHLAGFNVTIESLKKFRQLHSNTPGHPEYGHTEGIECTTGPLGQGIAHAVGMALGERMKAARFNLSNEADAMLIDHRTFVVLGDGCLMEGVSSEACSLAGLWKLNRLIAYYDANNITIDGTIDISFTENVKKRFESYGWNVLEVDGNDLLDLATATDQALTLSEKPNGETGPTLIICKTLAGKGSPKWEGKPKIHGNPMTAEDVQDAKRNLKLPLEPFAVASGLYEKIERLLSKNHAIYDQWLKRKETNLYGWKSSNPEKYRDWQHFFELNTQDIFGAFSFADAFNPFHEAAGATRTLGGKCLQALAEMSPVLVGGSADLAGSTLTTLPGSFINARQFEGRNIHFGVREHGMAAVCNGLALHGGFVPYCSTFAVFSDYMRPSIRLAALMKIPTIFILTHDSFYVGEDGPTHQPIEHVASLRLIPNLNVFRPANGPETFASWKNAVESTGPSALLLSRQDLPSASALGVVKKTLSQYQQDLKEGAYLVRDFSKPENALKLVFLASGSELPLVLSTVKELESKSFVTPNGTVVSLNIRVVSCPSPQKFVLNATLLNRLVPEHVPAISVEAGSSFGWGEIVGRNGLVFGINRFGASAPAADLAKEFGFTPAGLSAAVKKFLDLRES